jgi:hypothetical protein
MVILQDNELHPASVRHVVRVHQLNVILQTPAVQANRLPQILGNVEHSIKFSGNNELAGVVDEKGLS